MKLNTNTILMSKKRLNYLDWNHTFMTMAKVIAERSKDPSTQVGCCIVNHKQRIVGMGYNGFPRGCSDDQFPWCKEGEFHETKYAYVVHAEQNAILNTNQSDLDGAIMYVTRHPCNECAKSIIQSGITTIYYLTNPLPDDPSIIAACRMFRSSGISLIHFVPVTSVAVTL
jgi:dCMP deaminase